MTNNKNKIILTASGVLIAVAGIIVLVLYLISPVIKVSASATEFGESGYFTVTGHGFKQVIGADFSIEFDNKAVQIEEIENGNVFESVSVSEEAYANNNGVIQVVFLDYTGGDKPITLDGDLLYVKYKAMKPQDSRIALKDVAIVDDLMNYVDGFRVRNGKIKVN